MGPCSSLILRFPLSPSQLATIRNTLGTIGEVPEDEGTNRLLDLWINNTAMIDGTNAGEGRPCSVTPHASNQPDDETDLSAEELLWIESEFDFTPKYVIDICSSCNGREDHRGLPLFCKVTGRNFRLQWCDPPV